MNRIKRCLIILILIHLVACRNDEPIIVNDEVELLPIGGMADLDYQSSNNRFVGVKSGENISEVYVFDLDTGLSSLVSDSNSSTVNRHPTWNPKYEQLILFISNGEFDSDFWIGTIDITTSQRTAIVRGQRPEWLPDGESVAYITDFNQISVYKISTGQETLLLSPQLKSGDKIIEIAISPNGQDMDNPYSLVVEGLFIDELDWSSKSDYLIVQQIESKEPVNVLAFNLEKSCLTDKLIVPEAEIIGYEFVWSDDDQVVFVQGRIGNNSGLLKIPVNGKIVTNWLTSGECKHTDP